MFGTRWIHDPNAKQPHQQPWVVMLVILVLGVALVFSFTGCTNPKDSGIGDSPIGNKGDNAPWDIISSPDQYPNIATRCDPYQQGKRIYIVTHNHTDVQPIIVDDTGCAR